MLLPTPTRLHCSKGVTLLLAAAWTPARLEDSPPGIQQTRSAILRDLLWTRQSLPSYAAL